MGRRRASGHADQWRSYLQKPANEFQKLAWLLIAFGITYYAIHGLMTNHLIMPYKPLGGGRINTRLLHLRGMWAIGGSVCLLLGAAGFVVLFAWTLRSKPGTKPSADPYLYLAAGLILVGVLFFVGVTPLSLWLVRQ
jgi:hypothetical protein